MDSSSAPSIEVEQYHAILTVANLSAAIEFYTHQLGFVHAFSWGEPATMAGVNLGRTQIVLQQGAPPPTGNALYYVIGNALYYVIGNADALHEYQQGQGVPVIEAIGDRSWDFRDYSTRDPDGNVLTFKHRL